MCRNIETCRHRWRNAMNYSLKDINNNPQFLTKQPTTKMSYGKVKKMKIIDFDSLPARQFFLERLDISPGTLVLLVGTGCSGKTMLAQYLATCVGGDHKLFDTFAIKKGNVIHIDQEQSEKQTELRYMRLGNGIGIKNMEVERVTLNYRLDDSTNLNFQKTEEELTELCMDKVLCLVDSLKACSVADENSGEIEKVLKMLKRIAEKTQCVMLVVHHKGKGKDAKQSGRGHSSIYDSCDVQIDLDVNDEVYELSCAKSREAKYFAGIKYTLLDDGDYHKGQHCTKELKFILLQDDIKSTKQTQTEKVIEALLAKNQLKYNDLFTEVRGDRNKFNDVLKSMIDANQLSEIPGPRNSKLYSLTESYKNILSFS